MLRAIEYHDVVIYLSSIATGRHLALPASQCHSPVEAKTGALFLALLAISQLLEGSLLRVVATSS